MNALILLIGLVGGVQADTLSLDACYEQLRERYPLTDKQVLEQRIVELKKKNLHTRYYPRASVYGRASYQSDVTEVNFTPSNIPAPQFDKDQYTAELQVSQLIYGGGRIEGQMKALDQQGQLQQSQVDVSIHEVRQLVDRLYFNILRIEKNRASMQWTLKQVEAQLRVVESQVENGALLASNLHVLEAEKSKLQQQLISLTHDRTATYEMLSKLLDMKIDTTVTLKVPEAGGQSVRPLNFARRPEYKVFRQQKELLSAQKEVVSAEKGPELSAFATAGYGRPGLDRFDPDFQSYYVIGFQARWSLWDLLNADRDLERLELEQKLVEADRRAFERQLRSSIQKQLKEAEKLRKLMKKDRQIIKLREKIVETSESQLKNGVITSSDYLEELYEAKRARLQLELHKVELHYVQAQILTQMNESWN